MKIVAYPVLSICQQLARKFTCIRRIIFYRPAWKSRSKNSGIKFNLKDYIKNLQPSTPVMTSQMAIMDKALSRAYTETNPYNIQFLGGYDNNGMPDYLLGEEHNGITYPVAVDVPNGLVNRLNDVLTAKDNSSFAVSTKVINTNVLKDASIKLTFLGEEAEYRNAIGYYYYETQNPPKRGRVRIPTQIHRFPKLFYMGVKLRNHK